MNSRFLKYLGAAALGLAIGATPVAAQESDYPSKPVNVLIGFSAGGGIDLMGRMLSDKLAKRLGQPFVVENRVGAGGTVAGTAVATAAPDGYTLLMIPIAHAISASVQKDIPYDAVKDFAPVTIIATAPNVVVVNPKLGVNSLPELIELAKKEAGGLSYGSGGVGASTHLAAELLAMNTGTTFTHIPYKGGGDALTGVLTGEADINISSLPAAMAHLNSGALKGLAVTGTTRSSILPELPTAMELGIDYEYSGWYGLVAPAGTPAAVIEKLRNATVEILKEQEVKDFLAANGAEGVGSTPEEFATYLANEVEKWAKVAKAQNL